MIISLSESRVNWNSLRFAWTWAAQCWLLEGSFPSSFNAQADHDFMVNSETSETGKARPPPLNLLRGSIFTFPFVLHYHNTQYRGHDHRQLRPRQSSKIYILKWNAQVELVQHNRDSLDSSSTASIFIQLAQTGQTTSISNLSSRKALKPPKTLHTTSTMERIDHSKIIGGCQQQLLLSTWSDHRLSDSLSNRTKVDTSRVLEEKQNFFAKRFIMGDPVKNDDLPTYYKGVLCAASHLMTSRMNLQWYSSHRAGNKK